MKLYLRYFPDKYHELITYYPRFYKEVLEMDAILHAHGQMLDLLQDSTETVFLDAFISTADEDTMAIWENLLGLTYSGSPTLEERRGAVIAWLLGHGHIGEPEIREIIAQYTDADVSVDFDAGIIYITIESEVFDEETLLKTLLAKIPAHLALDMGVHTERSFTWTIPIGFGAADGTHLTAQPVSRDRSGQIDITAGMAAFDRAHIYAEPPAVNITAESGAEVANAAFIPPRLTGVPPDVLNASEGNLRDAGGIYCHTHVTSKLIG